MKTHVSKIALPSGLRFYDNNRSSFQKYFTDRILLEPGIDGRVLDIGCGADLPNALRPLRERLVNLDGVDPNEEEVIVHPLLKQRWAATLEQAQLQTCVYDLAYSYNVTEHVATPSRFLRRVADLLKPGGVYWALSNHSLHPFARIVKIMERLNLKTTYARNSKAKVNSYPAFYRMNSVKQLRNHCPLDSFASIDFHFYPCMQWDIYFPKSLRFLPHIYDRLLGTRLDACMMIFMVRLEKRS